MDSVKRAKHIGKVLQKNCSPFFYRIWTELTLFIVIGITESYISSKKSLILFQAINPIKANKNCNQFTEKEIVLFSKELDHSQLKPRKKRTKEEHYEEQNKFP